MFDRVLITLLKIDAHKHCSSVDFEQVLAVWDEKACGGLYQTFAVNHLCFV